MNKEYNHPLPRNHDDEEDRFFEEQQRMETFRNPIMENPPLHPPMPPIYEDYYGSLPKKSKFVAGLFSFFIPGTGHLYLGLMNRGLIIMMIFIMNIVSFPLVSEYSHGSSNVPFMVLLGCLLPVIYFYNIFDALQSTDQVNAYRRALQLGQIPMVPANPDMFAKQPKLSSLGIIIACIGVVLFFVSSKPVWLQDLFSMMGSYVGAVILIGAGLLLFLSETKKR